MLLVLFIVSQLGDRTTMIDLTLFKRPAFVGAQMTAFAISSSMFAMFLYLTLYLQNILGLSPLQTGAALPAAQRGLVLRRAGRRSALDARADPHPARSRARPERGRDVVDEPRHAVVGLDGAAAGIPRRRRRHRPRQRAARVDRGLDRAAVERAGMASGINNTFRQVGIATGIAALGAIFASKVDPRAFAPHPASSAQRLVRRAGCTTSCSSARSSPRCGAVLAAALVRPQDFVASGPAAELI